MSHSSALILPSAACPNAGDRSVEPTSFSGFLVYLLGLALVGEVLVHHSAPPRSIVIDPAKPTPTPRYTKPGDQWFAELPDGRRVLATYVQDYSGQRISRWKDLPWTGNKIGDARYLWEYKHLVYLACAGGRKSKQPDLDRSLRMAKQRPLQLGEGLTDQQQEAIVMLGKMMGPQTDSFDEEVQAQLNQHHKAEHDATDYEKEFAEIPHERGYAKMKAAQTGGSPGLGPTEARSFVSREHYSKRRPAVRTKRR